MEKIVQGIIITVGFVLVIIGALTLIQTVFKFDGVVFTCSMVEIIIGCCISGVAAVNMDV